MSLEQLREALHADQPQAALKPAIDQLSDASAPPQEQALAVGGELLTAWTEFRMGAVIKLLELMTAEEVDADLMKAVRRPLGDEFKRAQKWTKHLASIARQRQLAALRDAARNKRQKEVVALAEAIAQEGDASATLPLIGSVLGSVDTDPQGMRQLAQVVGQRLMLEPEQLQLIHDAIDRRMKSLYEGTPDNPEREFQSEMIAATIELNKTLPGANMSSKEAEAEATREFAAATRAVFAAAIRYPERDYWPTSVRLLTEFLPRDSSSAAKQAGVEERQYNSLAPRARRAVTRAFREIGRHTPVVEPLVQHTQKWLEQGHTAGTGGVEVLGALGNTAAQPLMLGLLKAKASPGLQALAVDALGRMGNDRAVEALFGFLKGIVNQRAMDAKSRQLAVRTISALGRVARSPKIDDSMRTQVMMMVRQSLPVDDHSLQARAVTELLTPRMMEKVDATFRKWAARILTEELWTPDQQASFAKMEEGSRPSQLGARQSAVELLEVLAQYEMMAILDAAEPRATRFSGALMAIGEVFAKVPSPEQLRILDLMIRTAATHSAGRQNEYAREQMWDVENETFVSLDREPVLESLAFAVVKIVEKEVAEKRPGEGVTYLEDLFRRVRSGELPSVGEKAARLLFDAYTKHVEGKSAGGPAAGGRAAALTPQPDTLDGEEALDPEQFEHTRAMEASDAASSSVRGGPPAAPAKSGLSLEQKVELLKQLKKGGLFAGKRRTARVQAMQQLAGVGDLDALPIIIDLLDDKDMLLSTAAGTALIEYTNPSQSAKTTELAVAEMIDSLTNGKLSLQRSLRKAMGQMNLMREPCRKALDRKLADADNPMGLAYELSMIMGLSSPEEAHQRITGAGGGSVAGGRAISGNQAAVSTADAPMGAPGASRPAAPTAGAAGGPGMSDLEKKRQLLAARREWIAGGKKGPEPK